jgi:hypothetical protein
LVREPEAAIEAGLLVRRDHPGSGVDHLIVAVDIVGTGVLVAFGTGPVGQRVAVAAVVVEQLLAQLGGRLREDHGGEVDLRRPPERKLERLEGVELVLGRQAEVDAFLASERLREMLPHRADRELAQRAGPGEPSPDQPVAWTRSFLRPGRVTSPGTGLIECRRPSV